MLNKPTDIYYTKLEEIFHFRSFSLRDAKMKGKERSSQLLS